MSQSLSYVLGACSDVKSYHVHATILNGRKRRRVRMAKLYMSVLQVKVLALTDHDTMAGIPEAVSAAHRFGMRIIPGVEISALYSPK